MPVQAKADGNVPFIGPRARYSVLGLHPTWHVMKMAGGNSLDGGRPRTAALTEDQLDPVVTSGRAVWGSLTKGGLFDMLGKGKKPCIVEAIDNAATATGSIVDSAGNALRAVPTTLPFKLAAGEFLKYTGGTAASYIGILVRLDAERL